MAGAEGFSPQEIQESYDREKANSGKPKQSFGEAVGGALGSAKDWLSSHADKNPQGYLTTQAQPTPSVPAILSGPPTLEDRTNPKGWQSLQPGAKEAPSAGAPSTAQEHEKSGAWANPAAGGGSGGKPADWMKMANEQLGNSPEVNKLHENTLQEQASLQGMRLGNAGAMHDQNASLAEIYRQQAAKQAAAMGVEHDANANQDKLNAERWGKVQSSIEAAKNDKIDPDRMYNGPAGVMRRIVGAISAAMGAYGAAMTHTPNFALQIIQKAQDDDIKAQEAEHKGKRENIEDTKGAYSQGIQEGMNAKAARAYQMSMAMGQTESLAKAQMATAQNDQQYQAAKEVAQLAAAQTAQHVEDLRREVYVTAARDKYGAQASGAHAEEARRKALLAQQQKDLPVQETLGRLKAYGEENPAYTIGGRLQRALLPASLQGQDVRDAHAETLDAFREGWQSVSPKARAMTPEAADEQLEKKIKTPGDVARFQRNLAQRIANNTKLAAAGVSPGKEDVSLEELTGGK